MVPQVRDLRICSLSNSAYNRELVLLDKTYIVYYHLLQPAHIYLVPLCLTVTAVCVLCWSVVALSCVIRWNNRKSHVMVDGQTHETSTDMAKHDQILFYHSYSCSSVSVVCVYLFLFTECLFFVSVDHASSSDS